MFSSDPPWILKSSVLSVVWTGIIASSFWNDLCQLSFLCNHVGSFMHGPCLSLNLTNLQQVRVQACISSGMSQLVIYVDLYYASFMPGAAAALAYASMLGMAPLGILSSSLLVRRKSESLPTSTTHAFPNDVSSRVSY